ncbi:phosphoglycolate phosphatase [Desulfitispora alkaliphila]|uniref:HAD family hydrolase n=1 Tax=Desulfitispora alkaliphila TaxID=622674 RepID=UPI003D1FB4DD
MKFEAVIFDLDGTLIDSIDDLADSVNAVLAKRGMPTHSREDVKYFVGSGMENLVLRAMPQTARADAELVNACIEDVVEEYGKNWAVKTDLYSGIPELLDSLTKQGISINVLSNKPHQYTKVVVEKFLSEWEFKIILGAREEVPKKPDPAGAIEIAEALNVDPEKILYLGDTNVDMETASRAGMYGVGVLWGFRKKEELEGQAKAIVAHPQEVLELL